ncbi:MAG TPA: TonB C-terminal domain-containing protein [Candidatus Fermentibacter daniensis]|nr:MAG: hypothetical protein AO396_00790 [Candidatus Fermentibacter daniensis]MBP7720281.1 TonB C-terminal domain-containing protein [Candidatus Fermentibacter sp.]KZD16855.1 MAG: hypothetical protein AO394_00850 [Candidatus Fermentibacter daniensis]MCC6871736.1 TonB C-terminal domain-containing protein [Candidatus Fermentibacter sp.]NLI01703.1 hypothetical protein [Candidatus Fermentibacter daniensis]
MNRSSLLISSAGHAAVILLALLMQGFSGSTPPLGGGDAVMVEMVTLGTPGPPPVRPDVTDRVEPQAQVEPQDPVDEAEDVVEEPVQTEDIESPVIEEPVRIDPPVEDERDRQEEPVQPDRTQAERVDTPGSQGGGYASVGGSGEAGGGAPGPATYEGRVFSAIRRNFRTSAVPQQSYRIEVTVRPDGSMLVDTLRKSGVDLFDRAVEHALAMAQMPPFPPGRTSPAVLRIEFLGLSEEQ